MVSQAPPLWNPKHRHHNTQLTSENVKVTKEDLPKLHKKQCKDINA
jgi:hypothetical protein